MFSEGALSRGVRKPDHSSAAVVKARPPVLLTEWHTMGVNGGDGWGRAVRPWEHRDCRHMRQYILKGLGNPLGGNDAWKETCRESQ